jgi:membrane protein
MNNRKNISAVQLWTILKKAASRLKENSPLHLAGSTAFFATFSLAPIFIIIIQLLGKLIGEGEIKRNIIQKFSESAPKESVNQLQRMLSGLEQLSGSWYVNAALALFLVFSASTLFTVIQSALYRLWQLKKIKDKSFGFKIKNRLFSVLLIVVAGLLLMAGLLGQSLQGMLGDAVEEISGMAYHYFQSIYRHVISFVLAWAWFAVVFRYLTDARPKWKTVVVGALFTAILFVIGKAILQATLTSSTIPTVYGASASLVLLQLFVFYISLLIYYGAAFTAEWAEHYHQSIRLPNYLGYYTVEEKQGKANNRYNG